MILKSYSKINLTLNVNSKSRNNLHEIQSIFFLVNLFDLIKIKSINKKQDKVSFNGTFSKSINKNDNSVSNLLRKLRELKLISKYYAISITKNIPVFGGLGGGSSNAASVLKFLLTNKVDKRLLNKLENTIGTDLRLFFTKQGYLKNLRTIIEFKKKHKFFFLLIQPKIKCSTKEIYSKVKKFTNKKKFNQKKFSSKVLFIDYLSKNKNDLQFIVEKKHPQIRNLLTDIKNIKGCYFSRMTGSGSVCYGLFSNQITAKKAFNKIKNMYPKFWVSLAKTV